MTSGDDTLRQADRAAAAPFLEQPRTRWWYPPFMAAFFTGLAAGPVLVAEGRGGAGFAVQGLVLVGFLAFTVGYRRQAGTSPRMRSAPPEITRAYLFLLLAGGACVGVTAAAWSLAGPVAGLSALFVTSLAVVWAYERAVYPQAAARVRRRLA